MYYISIFIILLILLVLFLFGILTLAVPALRRFFPLVSKTFLYMLAGYVAGFLLCVLFPVGLYFLADWIPETISFPQTIGTLSAILLLASPIVIPMLGALIGAIISIKRFVSH